MNYRFLEKKNVLNKIRHFQFTMPLTYLKPRVGTTLFPHLQLSTIHFLPQQNLTSNIYSYNLTPFFPGHRNSLLMQTFNEVFSIAMAHF